MNSIWMFISAAFADSEVKSMYRNCSQSGVMDIYLLNYITMLKYNPHGLIGGSRVSYR